MKLAMDAWISAVEAISKLREADLEEFARKHGCPGLGPWREVLGGATHLAKVRLLWTYVRVVHVEGDDPVLAVWVTGGNHKKLRPVRGNKGDELFEIQDRRFLIAGSMEHIECHARRLWENLGRPGQLGVQAMICSVRETLPGERNSC